MVATDCRNCGGICHWSWTDAFLKFDDGDVQVETEQVKAILKSAGYEVEDMAWGAHNTVIISIKRDGVELIPQDREDFSFGYDDPRQYLPEEIIKLLDEKLPDTY